MAIVRSLELVERDLSRLKPYRWVKKLGRAVAKFGKRVYKNQSGYVVVTYRQRYSSTYVNRIPLSKVHEENVADVRAKHEFHKLYRTHSVAGCVRLSENEAFTVDYYYDKLLFKNEAD